MAALVLRLITLSAVGFALIVWLRQIRTAERRPAARAICVALALLTLSMTIQLLFDPLSSRSPIPGFPHFLIHVTGMIAAFYLTTFCLHIGLPMERVAARVRLRRWLLFGTLAALAALYVVGPLRGGLSRITSEAGETPFVVEYLAVFAGYIGMTMLDVCWISRTAWRARNRWIRRGMQLLGAGAAVGLAYAALRVFSAAAAAADRDLPWSNAGPSGVGTYLMLAAIFLMMSGILLPPLAHSLVARATAETRIDPGSRS